MAKYLSIYPPDVDCNTDSKIFIRFKVFNLPSTITDNFYNVRVVIRKESWIFGDAERWIRCGNLAPGDYTSRGKAVLWDRTFTGATEPAGDYKVKIELYNNVGTLLEDTAFIKFTINTI
jgi:hypothetical protein